MKRTNPLKWFFQLTLVLAMFLPVNSLFAQAREITGTVTDTETNEPLIGVNVSVSGTTSGAISNLDGMYSINASTGQSLLFSYIGYQDQEITITDQTQINVIMSLSTEQIDELVVVGYGVMKKSDLTGAVSSVATEDIEGAKTNNAVEILQGKISGVDITRSSGEAGSGFNILVRGARSLTASNAPIYIVDGVDYGSNININPNDIASMEVLKDASSTAIYGSRGANGVILITTKKGTANEPVIAFNTYFGITSPLGKINMENSDQYIQRISDIKRFAREDRWDLPADDPLLDPISALSADQLYGYEHGTDFDWFGAQMEDFGTQQDYHFSISGGNDNTTYAVSLNNFIEDGFIPNDKYDRKSIKTSINSKVNDFFEFGNSSFFSFSERTRGRGLNVHLVPLVTPYDTLGNLVAIPDPGHVPFQNPLIDQDPVNRYNQTYNTGIFSTFYAQLNLAEGLSFRSSFNVNMDFSRNGNYVGEVEGLSRVNEGSITNTESYKYTWTNVLTYDKSFGDHHFMLTGATETMYSRAERLYIYGTEFDQRPDTRWYTLATATGDFTAVNANVSPLTEYALQSYIGRIHYSYLGKYMVTATGRYDGASQLVDKWDFFPSASVAWRISEEDFMTGNSIVNNLKLRFGYGVTGNQSSPAYSSLGSIATSPMYYEYGDADGGVLGYYTYQLDTYPRWEKTSAVNLGIDFGLYANRISGSIELYSSHTTDLLQEVQLPPTSAVTSVIENIGETKGKGIEVMLSTVNVSTSELNWTTDFTFSANQEQIVALQGGVLQDIANGWFVGSPIQVFYDLEKTGIWQRDDILTEAEALEYGITRMDLDTDGDGTDDAIYRASIFGSEPGKMMFTDVNGDTAISEEFDRKIMGTARPLWTGGLKSTLTYKNFDFSFFVYARIGQTVYDRWLENWAPDARERSIVRDYWTPSNPTDAYPTVDQNISRAGWGQKTALGYVDGSFVKIKDITLGYTIPAGALDIARVSSLRIYASAKNYFAFGKLYSQGRYDVEAVNGSGQLSTGFPVPKMIIVGANLTF